MNSMERIINRIVSIADTSSDAAIIAIDGSCGSGKSTLANQLGISLDCNVFHMDDFFLPPERKTVDRLQAPGGNVDYERFEEEILIPISAQRAAYYRKYSCQTGQFSETVAIAPKKISIVEGAYSMHPRLINYYCFKVFLTIDPNLQLERIRQRNSPEKYRRFIEEWIPLENKYFNDLSIQQQADLVIDSSEFSF